MKAASPHQIDLRHHGCGGFFHHWATRGSGDGGWLACFQCEKCEERIETPADDAASREREAQRMTAFSEMLKAVPEPPHEEGRAALFMEALVLAAYSAWSEDRYSAGFILPTPSTVREFRQWLQEFEVLNYHEEMLRLWNEQG